MQNFAHILQIGYTSIVMEPSIPFHTRVNFFDAQVKTKEKSLDQPLEIDDITSNLETQIFSAETFDPNPEIMFKQTIDLNIRSKPQFRKHCTFCHKSNHSISIFFSQTTQKGQNKTEFFFLTEIT